MTETFLFSNTRHRAESLRLCKDLSLSILATADLLATSIVSAQVPTAVKSVADDRATHVVNMQSNHFCLFISTNMAKQRGIFIANINKHAGNQNRFGNLPGAALRGLERFVRIRRKAVQV